MTGFDIAVLLIVGLGAVSGFLRGFVQEILSLGAWMFSLIAIHYMHTPLTEFLVPHVGRPWGAATLAFALLLLIPYAAIKVVAGRMGEASRNSMIGPIDRVLGFGFGLIKGAIIVVLIFSILMLAPDTLWGTKGRPLWITQSRTYPLVNSSTELLVKMVAERRKALQHDDADADKAADSKDQDGK